MLLIVKKLKVNEIALQMMERLKKKCLFQPITLHTVLEPTEPVFCLLYLNIRSFKEHFQDICRDIDTEFRGLFSFSVTKVYYSKYQFNQMEYFVHQSNNEKHENVIHSNL